MDLLDLRASLAALLANDLGSYTLGNNATTPALSVRTNYDNPPPYKSVDGLELVIEQLPASDTLRQYDAEALFRNWTLYLIAWDGSDPTDAAAKISRTFPGTTTTLLSVPPELGPPRQLRMTVPANSSYSGPV